MTEFEIELLGELRRLRIAVEKMVIEDETQAEAAPECGHPIDSRIDFGITNGWHDWQCGICGHRTVTNG